MSPTAAMLILVNHKPSSGRSQETSGSMAVPVFGGKGSGFKRFLDCIHVFEERSSVERSNVEARGENSSSGKDFMEKRFRKVLEFCW